MESKRLKQLCQRGIHAEGLIESGQTRKALEEFIALAHDLETKGDFDSFVAAKVTLGKLRCHIKLGDF